MLTLSDKQKTVFSEIMGNLPKAAIFGEIGDMGNEGGGSVDKELETRIKAKRKEDDKLEYADAARQVFEEDPAFAEKYNEIRE